MPTRRRFAPLKPGGQSGLAEWVMEANSRLHQRRLGRAVGAKVASRFPFRSGWRQKVGDLPAAPRQRTGAIKPLAKPTRPSLATRTSRSCRGAGTWGSELRPCLAGPRVPAARPTRAARANRRWSRSGRPAKPALQRPLWKRPPRSPSLERVGRSKSQADASGDDEGRRPSRPRQGRISSAVPVLTRADAH